MAGVLAVAAAVRLANLRLIAPDVPLGGDATLYRRMAVLLVQGRGYLRPLGLPGVRTDVPTAEFPPLFPFALSLLRRAGAVTVTEQRLSLALLGLVTVVLVAHLGRAVGGPAVGLVSGLLAAVHPMLFQLETAIAAEVLYAPLVAAVLLLAVRLARGDARTRWWVALGVLIGLAALTRAEAVALVALLALPLALLVGRGWARAGRVALAGLGVAAVVAPWTIRNAVVVGDVVPISSNTGTLLAGSNCPSTYADGPLLGLWDFSCVTRLPWNGMTETERARRDMRVGLRFAVEHRGELVVVVPVRVLRTFGLHEQRNQAEFEALEGRSLRLHLAATRASVALLAAAVAGLLVLRDSRVRWVLLSTIVLVVLSSALGYGNQRFRVAAEPSLAVAGAVAAVHALRAAASAVRARVPILRPA